MKKITIIAVVILTTLFSSCTYDPGTSRIWTSFVQTVDIETQTEKKFKVVASVKVETDDPQARAGVWARVDTKTGQTGFFENMRNRPITSSNWESYTIEGTINEDSRSINLGGILYYNGKFYFDKYELYVENDEGVYELVSLQNASFEEGVTDQDIPNWDKGISEGQNVKVKGYTFTVTQDATDGKQALLINGVDISTSQVTAATIKEAFPNLGIYIGTLLILILAFSLMTYHSSTSNTNWSILGKIGFRFSFIYFTYIILFQNNGAYPYFGKIIQKPLEWLQGIVLWFGDNIIKVPYDIAVGPNGSGDTTYDYLVVIVGFLVASLGALLWSIIDRKRTNYTTLYYWLTTGMRYYVGLMLISYGLVKVIQLQFSYPTFYRLLEPYGESSPMGLAWTFLGFSEGYNLFMGIAEVLAGLLLFRRTQTLGAIITLMTAMNVMAVNYFYDVPVKLLSTHLVLMTLFLLSRDLKRVLSFLVTNKPVEQLSLIARPKLKKTVNISLNVFKGLVIAYALGYGFFDALSSKKIYGSAAPKPDLYGVYEVNNLVINNDTITNYKSDRLWKHIVFESEGRVTVYKRNASRSFYSVEVDTTNQKVKFYASRNNPNDYFDFQYTKTDSTLNYNYIYKNDTIFGQTKRLDKKDFLLTGRGFNWINERPFNR